MRHHASSLPLPAQNDPNENLNSWRTLAAFFPYLWQFRKRLGIALALMLAAKLCTVAVPLVMKAIVDRLTPFNTHAEALLVPIALLITYALLRMGSSFFTELREWVFARVSQRVLRLVVLRTFRNLLDLSLNFHINRQTGAISRDMERGSRAISSLMSFGLYSMLPTLVEVLLVMGVLFYQYSIEFVLIAIAALCAYIVYTVKVTQWRIGFRREMNEQDSKANNKAMDALVNYETVKYFNNEDFETQRYDESLQRVESATLRSQSSLSILNIGQALIIAIAVSLLMWRATVGVVEGRMSVGDFVLVNAFMLQLYMPLNFLGVLYRELRQAIVDIERLFRLLNEQADIKDSQQAQTLASQDYSIHFDNVSFSYGEKPVLIDVSFSIAAGHTVAVVGESGSGKTTLSRLLFRMYDVNAGAIRIGAQNICNLTLQSVRQSIGIVPQDTVLFNDTIAFNVAYGNIVSDVHMIEQACKRAQIHDFIIATEKGYQSQVGDRGLKLSGGEKQRIAIARALLKDPPILVFDEATSALDSSNEREIQRQLRRLAVNKTVLIIAHRLSTIIHAHQIIVLEKGQIIECGTHESLLINQGKYAKMWQLQQSEQEGRVPA